MRDILPGDVREHPAANPIRTNRRDPIFPGEHNLLPSQEIPEHVPKQPIQDAEFREIILHKALQQRINLHEQAHEDKFQQSALKFLPQVETEIYFHFFSLLPPIRIQFR